MCKVSQASTYAPPLVLSTHPLYDTHALCLALAYHSLCRVQATFYEAHAFNQPLEAWDVSRVTVFGVRAASRPLLPYPLTRTPRLAFAYHSLCRVQLTFQDANAFNQPLEAWNVSRVTTLEVRAASHPLHPSPPTRTRCASLLLTIRFAECRLPSTARMPSTNPSRRGTSRGSRT